MALNMRACFLHIAMVVQLGKLDKEVDHFHGFLVDDMSRVAITDGPYTHI